MNCERCGVTCKGNKLNGEVLCQQCFRNEVELIRRKTFDDEPIDLEIKRRAGRFEISDSFLESEEDIKRLMSAIMSRVFIVRCEHDFTRGVFMYDAYSFLFDIVEYGCEAPSYKFITSPEGISVERVTVSQKTYQPKSSPVEM